MVSGYLYFHGNIKHEEQKIYPLLFKALNGKHTIFLVFNKRTFSGSCSEQQ